MHKKIIIFSFISCNIFAGNFWDKSIEEIVQYEQTLDAAQKEALRKEIIEKNRQIFLQVIEPGFASLPYAKRYSIPFGPPGINNKKLIKDGEVLVITLNEHKTFDFCSRFEQSGYVSSRTQIFPNNKVYCSDISPDGGYILFGHDFDTISLFDLKIGNWLFQDRSLEVNLVDLSVVVNIVISPDSKFAIIETMGTGGNTYYFNFQDHSIKKLGATNVATHDQSHCTSISQDGKFVLSGNTGDLVLYNLDQKKNKKINMSNYSEVAGAFIVNDKFGYVAHDMNLCRFELESGKTEVVAVIPEIAKQLAVDPSYRYVCITGHKDNIYLVDLSTLITKKIVAYDTKLDRGAKYFKIVFHAKANLLINQNRVSNTLSLTKISKWAIDELSITQLLILLKAYHAKDLETIWACYKYFEQEGRAPHKNFDIDMVKHFFAKLLMAFYFQAPRELQDIVKAYMG